MVRALFVFLGLLVSSQSFAQQSILGTYQLVANDIRVDGQPIETMKSPRGYLVITPKIAMLFFTSTERKPGNSPEAKAALLDSMAAWAGPYRVDGERITVSVDTAWNEVWTGTQQTRSLQINGKRVSLVSPPMPSSTQPGKTLTSRTEWERID